MPQFYASTSMGLSQALADELRSMDIKVGQIDKQGCLFEGPWTDCVKANLRSRIATRISLPVLDFPAYNAEDIYNNVNKHDFTKYLTPELSFAIKAKLNDCAVKDQRLLAMKVKDVIADQFNEKFGKRPDVDKEIPNVRIFIFGSRNEYRVSVDTSGHSLSQRGYRQATTEAPLREHVAAGLLQLTNWDGQTPVVDPMCGSGTFLIEAALKYKKIATGTFHKKFAFQYFSHIPSDLFDEELEKVLAEEIEETEMKFYGFDSSGRNIKAAEQNAERAGVADMIVFAKGDATQIDPPVEKGIMITNPPYGIRMGDEFFLEELYKEFAHNLKTKFVNWDLWLLSGDAQWTKFLRMKANKRHPIDNGGVDCRWIHYKINKR